MLLSAPIAYARAQAQTDSNGLTDANAIIFANAGLNNFHRQLIQSGVDASQLQETYRDATVNVGTYLYPDDMLALKTISLNYVNTTQADYKIAEQVDVANLPNNISFEWLRTNADPNRPQFDDRGDWYEIFPTPTSAHNLSQAIRLFYFLKPTQYTTTGDTVAYPENMDESILGLFMAARYLKSLRDPGSLATANEFLAEYQRQVQDYISTLSRGSQQPITAVPIQLSGWEF